MQPEFKNLLIDFYELTMGQVYFNNKMHNKIVYFDVFFRKVPDGGSFAIANGVQKCVQFLSQFKFSDNDIKYLKSLNMFTPEFLNELKQTRFTGDCIAVEDGTIVFPNEPVITIKARLLEAQLVETALLMYFNHGTLITTKTSRIVRSAKGRAVMEFGSRRAQGEAAAVDGAMYAFCAGAAGTACTETGNQFDVPVLGTMAHSFVQSFKSEYEAFKAYAQTFPNACTLLVDTYNTLKSGIPNAIKVQKEILGPMGKHVAGIRIDSGDLAYLSKQARKMLDENGMGQTRIVVSNSLDENIINSLLQQKAPIDSFGVGENMITAKSDPVFGGVYKLAAVVENGKVIPKIKISDNTEKITNPHAKTLYRLYDKDGKIISDYLTVYDEKAPKGKIVLKHPEKNWVTKEISDFKAVDIRQPMILNGKINCKIKNVFEVKKNVEEQLATLWEEALRLENPHEYTVNLSDKLLKIKNDLLQKNQ